MAQAPGRLWSGGLIQVWSGLTSASPPPRLTMDCCLWGLALASVLPMKMAILHLTAKEGHFQGWTILLGHDS